MRSLKSLIFVTSVVGSLGVFALNACTSGGDPELGYGDLGRSQPATDPPKDGVKLPAPSDTPDDQGHLPGDHDDGTIDLEPDASPSVPDSGPGTDSNPQDAGSDAAVDSGTTPVNPGSPDPGAACSVAWETFTRKCGRCGTSEALCEGNLVVSNYGICQDEKGECVPGETRACGNCGTQTCGKGCGWGDCKGEPKDACSPGTKSYITASCTEAQTYRARTCENTCTWSAPSSTCEAPVHAFTLKIADKVGGTVAGEYLLTSTQIGKAVTSCSSSYSLSTETDYPYEVVEIENATGKEATIAVWTTSVLVDKKAVSTRVTQYDTNIEPQTDVELTKCKSSSGSCSSISGCVSPNAGISSITLKPNYSVLVRVASYYGLSYGYSSSPATGPFGLSVRTLTLK